MAAPSLILDALACLRGDRLLFSRLDLTLGPAQAAVVRGPNGAGKSSLLRMIAGLLPPAAGSIVRTGRVALADDALALDPDRPLAGALLFWVRLDGGGAQAVADALAMMGMEALADVPVRFLSTGQRRRAGLARVMGGNADIWLLDEPANGLDAGSLRLLETAIAWHRMRGGIALVATHQPIDLPDARAIAL